MVDNQNVDTSQEAANPLFDESVFTDAPSQVESAPESSSEQTLTPTDAFQTPQGEEAPQAAPSQPETPQPVEAKNDDTRYQYWQSQAAQRDNELKETRTQLAEMKTMLENQIQSQQQPEEPVEKFPDAPERPKKPRSFNRQEAFEDPSSDSARYLDDMDEWRDNMDEWNSLKMQYDNAAVQEQVDAMREKEAAATRQREAQKQQAEQLQTITQHVQTQYGMTHEETQDFIKTMSNPESISVDNLVQLYRLQNGKGNATPNGQPAQPSPQFQQTQRAQAVPAPMGVQPTANNAATNSDPADTIMDNMISDYKKNNPW
jgi:hypothetical protein